MLIKEIITEAISATGAGKVVMDTVRTKLPTELSSWWENSVDEMPMHQYTVDPRAKIKHAAGTEMVEEFLNFFFVKIMTREFRAVYGSKEAHVIFDELPENMDAKHFRETITFNSSLLAALAEIVHVRMIEIFIANKFNVRSIQWSDLSEDIESSVNFMAQLFVHELTHGYQYARSRHRVSDMGYRSYLERDRAKFLDLINRGVYGAEYLSSPQEISAHAQEYAYKIISTLSGSREEQAGKLREIMRELSTSGTKYASLQRDNQVQNRSANRFLKQLYQELDKHLDELGGAS